jgi:hypothetical protein
VPTDSGARFARLFASAVLVGASASAAAAAAPEPMIEFVVVRADTLIGLSRSVLVSPASWREVARLNRLPDPNRILPGQVLRIPTRLLRAEPTGAKLVSVTGDVRAADAAASTGTPLAEGQSVQTGAAGSAVIELADGSRLRLPPSSLAQLAASRRLGERSNAPASASAAQAAAANAPSGWFAGTMRVLGGSVEVFATKVLRAKPLEVVTPTAIIGVRGTHYRVGVDVEGAGRTRAEVVDGAVRIDAVGNAAGADLTAGFGAIAAAGGAAPKVAKLLAAPELSAVPERFDQLVVHFALPAETLPLRVQIAADRAFDQVVSDQRIAPGTEVRIAGLDDAQWHLRARRIDPQGIEGFDATRAFVLKARPQPPAYRAPSAGAKQAVGGIEFSWAPNVDAPQARLQIAEDAAFTRIVEERAVLDASTLRAEIGNAGSYFWRLASVRANGDRGPFGEARAFELRPLPSAPAVSTSADGGALSFTWRGRAQDRQLVELSRDAGFTQIETRAELDAPQWTLPVPARGGRYYFRYRSVEPDGFVSPYSETLLIEVPRDWSGLMLLLPLLLLL